MKKFLKLFISMPFMAVALLIFALSMAVATFMERDYGAPVARYLIYNSWWFELIQLILVINFIGNIFNYKLYKRAKLSIFIFHIAFVIILLGAAITRYTGVEGTMTIKEGESTNKFLSVKSYLSISSFKNTDTLILKKELFISPYLKKKYSTSFNVSGKEYTLELSSIIPNAQKTYIEDPNGQPYIEMVIASKSGMQTYYIQDQSNISFQGQHFKLNIAEKDSSNRFFIEKNKLYIESSSNINTLSMQGGSDTTILPSGTRNELKIKQLYSIGDVKFVIKNFSEKAKLTYMPGDWTNGVEFNVLAFTLKSGDKMKEVFVPSVDNEKGEAVFVWMNDQEFSISHGATDIELPFELKLKDFKLDRYPGSESPSSYSSLVTLIDPKDNINADHLIYMNNILEHKGYRFYQSSYTNDELGTVLSVNHDKPGTIITYLGYFLLALGMFWSIFNRNSHFVDLIRKTSEIRLKRKSVGKALMVLMLLASQHLFAQDSITYIDKEHSKAFGTLLMQDEGGRIKPFNTLNSELLRKISRKEEFNGLNPNQVCLGMMLNPEYWQNQPMIKVGNPDLKKIIGTDQNLVSFNQLIDMKKGTYLLKEYVAQANEKQPSMRNKLDKEILAVDERLNLTYQILSGAYFTIFPDSANPTQKWLLPNQASKIKDKAAKEFALKVFSDYYNAMLESQKTKDWSKTTEILKTIIAFQRENAKGLAPSETKVKLEIQYVNYDIFNTIYKFYGTVGFLLLVVLFISILYPKTNLKIPIIIGGIILGLLFLFHTYGLGIRWYISGHAPWSNGYESMIYIAWATMLAGFIFMKRSVISLAATALLASIFLMVAHLSWMDPEITNLVPVLKSYWLTIHVSVITASYGFLGLGALLGIISLLFMLFKNKKNVERIELAISELTNVNHMTLILGLYLLTIGTFLGGVWANESWGRYWGWDPKETWALITVIIYSFIVHTRFIPSLNNNFSFNVISSFGYTSVMMTYFGVNYLLSGLHSYGKGEPAPIPNYVYYILGVIAIIAIVAYFRNKKTETIVMSEK
jgi:cytochrome c-type biogenesis protein CcsB